MCGIPAKKSDGTVTQEDENNYTQHIANKNAAREEKEKDKKVAGQDPSKMTVTFDLEAVLTTPHMEASQMYYKRKLCVYNLSLYSLASKDGTCYVWNEMEGKRGACEISTCLYMFLMSLPATVKHVTLYSDNSTGQNRNTIVAACLLFVIQNGNLDTVDHKFLESGHTWMESDSIHAAIDHAKKNSKVYIPQQWETVISLARRRNPYKVIPVKKFYDFKAVCKCITNTKMDTDGQKVNWLNIKWLQVNKSEPEVIKVKHSFSDEFSTLRVLSTRRGRTQFPSELSTLYEAALPISSDKKQDLVSLCRQGVIPSEYHQYYNSLPTTSA